MLLSHMELFSQKKKKKKKTNLINLLIRQLLPPRNILLTNLMIHIRLNPPRRHTIHRNFLISTINRHTPHKRLNRALRARIHRMFGNPLRLTRDGTHEDNPPANGKVFVGFSGHEKLSSSVDAHDAVVFFFCDVFEMAERYDSGIRTHDV